MKLSIQDIEKSYDRKIIKNLSYEFQSGKLYVIKGVSGCGKSTLLNIIGGVEKEFNGTIQIDGKSCNAQQMLSLTGYVFQYSLLLSGITIRENLELIHGDMEKIERLCDLFGVKDLLEKYPDQISGGERQRISIVRALLQNPKIVLLDEPTASLDETNSKVAADAVAGLKSADRIVIVATHEAYFDELTDEILHLDYGEIAEVHKNAELQAETGDKIDCILQEDGKKKGKINSLRYNLKRNRQLFRFFSLLPYTVMFLLLAFVSTVQKNFESEYMKMIQKNYPVDAFNIYGFELDEFIYKDDVLLYDRYIIVDDGSTAHYLAPEEESVLAIEGMLEFGAFPQSNNEIIISRELALDLNGENTDLKQLLGNTLAFADKKFVITGILYSFNEMERDELANGRFMSYFLSDYYYHNIVGRLLFIPYETIKTMGEPVDTDVKRGVYKGLYNDKTAVESLRKALVSGKINVFDGEIASAKSELKGIIRILLMVVGVCFVIACVFMSSQIQTELFYRRKELGYLQIFGLRKRRVRELVFSGYFWKIVVALCVAGMIYIIVCVGCSFVLKSVLFFDVVHMAVMISGMMLFYCVFVYLSVCNFLRKDIVRLITE